MTICDSLPKTVRPLIGQDRAGPAVHGIAAGPGRRQKDVQAGHDARHDVPTGLPDRPLLECWPDRLLDTALADRLETVHGPVGRSAGDRPMQAVALETGNVVAKTSFVARHDADRFVVLLPSQAGLAAARDLAEQLVRSRSRPFDLGGTVFAIGARTGVAAAPPCGIQKRTSLDRTHVARLAAKSCGGGCAPVLQRPAADGVRRAG